MCVPCPGAEAFVLRKNVGWRRQVQTGRRVGARREVEAGDRRTKLPRDSGSAASALTQASSFPQLPPQPGGIYLPQPSRMVLLLAGLGLRSRPPFLSQLLRSSLLRLFPGRLCITETEEELLPTPDYFYEPR